MPESARQEDPKARERAGRTDTRRLVLFLGSCPRYTRAPALLLGVGDHRCVDAWRGALSIFVSIAAYRDPQLVPTIQDCLAKARYPEQLRFGISWQHGPEESSLPFR